MFVNVTNDMTITYEEMFGPVLRVIAYETEEEAVWIADDTSVGLHGFVSEQKGHAEQCKPLRAQRTR